MAIVYKVVTSTRRSCVIRGKAARHYVKGKTIFPFDSKCPLLAFKDRLSARSFIRKRNCCGEQILKCRAKVSRKKVKFVRRITVGMSLSFAEIREVWSGKQRIVSYDPTTEFPGTVLCSSITPLE